MVATIHDPGPWYWMEAWTATVSNQTEWGSHFPWIWWAVQRTKQACWTSKRPRHYDSRTHTSLHIWSIFEEAFDQVERKLLVFKVLQYFESPCVSFSSTYRRAYCFWSSPHPLKESRAIFNPHLPQNTFIILNTSRLFLSIFLPVFPHHLLSSFSKRCWPSVFCGLGWKLVEVCRFLALGVNFPEFYRQHLHTSLDINSCRLSRVVR